MCMIWLLQDWFPLTLFGSLVVMSFRYTRQWSFWSRLVVAFSRFVALVLILLLLLSVGLPVIRAVQQSIAAASSALTVRVVVVPAVHTPVVQTSSTSARPAGTRAPGSAQQQGSVLGGPSLSPGFMDQVLSRYGSP